MHDVLFPSFRRVLTFLQCGFSSFSFKLSQSWSFSAFHSLFAMPSLLYTTYPLYSRKCGPFLLAPLCSLTKMPFIHLLNYFSHLLGFYLFWFLSWIFNLWLWEFSPKHTVMFQSLFLLMIMHFYSILEI